LRVLVLFKKLLNGLVIWLIKGVIFIVQVL